MKRKLTMLLLAALLPVLLTLPAQAAEAVYDETEQPVIDEEMVWLTNEMAYDLRTREFVYPVGDSGTEVRATVADGMIVTGTVKIVGNTLLIYRDGKLREDDSEYISDPGEYVVMAQTGNQTPRLFTFTLVGEATSKVYSYNLPTGMIVQTATRNGEETDYDRTIVPMQEDGLYHVEYECISTGVIYVLDINVDRTPPEVTFSGKIDKNNRVHSALSVSGLKPSDVMRVTVDGNPIDVTVNADGTGELTQSGSYIITVYDAAGNVSEYGYTVMLYLNASAVVFFVILAAAIIAVIAYILIKRKRLEIG